MGLLTENPQLSSSALPDFPRAGYYRVIYADPPWTFVTRSPKGKGRSAERHYGCMTIDDIMALPVASPEEIRRLELLGRRDRAVPQAGGSGCTYG